ncbi:hypothetical protein HQN87_03525 [Paenibacillus tritici]|uniref:Uncharacterized protein n=1 Tax=Paenibacillus tritici TaxID=1873425 RepID=A0ABX2DIF4_9BACL|nr:hypothetical protein [Paenibacillus tritici]NQX44393.1 hypothetical protein [Paenibacillus tritici]
MRKKLPVSKNSFLTAYPHYVNISSVLFDDRMDEPFNLWISNIKTSESKFNAEWFETEITEYSYSKKVENRVKVILSDLNKISCHEGDLTGCNDSFKYIHTEMKGDGYIEIEIEHFKNTGVWAKAGLMFRESLCSDSRYISILATPSVNGIIIQTRESAGTESQYEYICASLFPTSMKIERMGDRIHLYCRNLSGKWEYIRTIEFELKSHAFMGISLCSPENNAYLNWIATNFIQLYCFQDFNIHAIPMNYNAGIYLNDDFYSFCPYLRVQNIKYSLLKKNNINITEFIINALDDDNYIDVYLNEYFVPQGKGFGKYEYHHGNMIYGYDLQSRTFNIVGYSEHSVIRHSLLSFQELEDAMIEDGREGWYGIGLLSIFKLHPYFTYKFNLDLMLQQLEDYINAKNSLESCSLMENYDSRIAHGISVYDYLILNISEFQRDIRPLHVIWEHKKIMLLRLKYLKSHNYLNIKDFEFLYNEYSSIERLAMQTRNLQLKNNLRYDLDNIDRIQKNIEMLKCREKDIIPKLIQACQPNHNNN